MPNLSGKDFDDPSYAPAANGSAAVGANGFASYRYKLGSFGPAQLLDPSASAKGVTNSGPIHSPSTPPETRSPSGPEQTWTTGYMLAALHPAGATHWQAPVTLAQVFFTGTFEASVAMDATGDATSVWAGDTAVPFLYTGASAVTFQPGVGFSQPVALGMPAAYEVPDVAYDNTGDVWVVWRTYDSNTSTSIIGRVLAEEARGKFPGKPTTISSDNENVWPPALAAAGSSALAAWPIGDFSGPTFHIQESDTEPLSAAPAPGTTTTPTAPAPKPVTPRWLGATPARRTGRGCLEPNVRGMTVRHAKNRLHRAGCTARVVRRRARHHGHVIAESGVPGHRYPKNHAAVLVVAR